MTPVHRKSGIVSVKHFYLIWILIYSIHRPLHEIEQHLRRGLFFTFKSLFNKVNIWLDWKTKRIKSFWNFFFWCFFFCSMLNAVVITTMNYLIIWSCQDLFEDENEPSFQNVIGNSIEIHCDRWKFVAWENVPFQITVTRL